MYRIILTKQAVRDILSIMEYISISLDNKTASDAFYVQIRKKIKSLSEFPNRFSEIMINKTKCHRMPVDKFNVYYCVDKQSQTVTIARVLYSGIDINQVAIIN